MVSRYLLKTGIAVLCMTFGCFTEGAIVQKPDTACRVFVRGGSNEIAGIKTPWVNASVKWQLISQAGIIGQGKCRSDVEGVLTVTAPVPEVRSVVHLDLRIKAGKETLIVIDVIVVPKDPFRHVRKTFSKMGIGIIDVNEEIEHAVLQSRLKYVRIDNRNDLLLFDGKVVIMGDHSDKFIDVRSSLPESTLIVIVNCSKDNKLTRLYQSLFIKTQPADSTVPFIDRDSILWTGLEPKWLDTAVPGLELNSMKRLTSLRVLAGRLDPDGSVFPLALEIVNFSGKRMLIWNISDPPDRNDPRWNLILRSSILWAHKHTFTQRTVTQK